MKVIGVAYRKTQKINWYDPSGLHLKVGDEIIVQTDEGLAFGQVVTMDREVPEDELEIPPKKILRRLSRQDQEKKQKIREKERKAFQICQKKIEEHNLPMRLIGVEYLYNMSKAIFYFTAEERVDFRNLAKALSSSMKTRVELQQIGVRSEAKMHGALGPCGKVVCCAQFSSDFESVSLQMAREQDLSLNPAKISGVCGRLMCCLKYEFETYAQFKKEAPPLNTEVETEGGRGKIVGYNIPKESVIIETDEGKVVELKLKDLKNQFSRRSSDGGAADS